MTRLKCTQTCHLGNSYTAVTLFLFLKQLQVPVSGGSLDARTEGVWTDMRTVERLLQLSGRVSPGSTDVGMEGVWTDMRTVEQLLQLSGQ